MIYDIFYVSAGKVDSNWDRFKQRFPSSQKIENVKTLDDIKKRAFTKFFWVVWDNVVVLDTFNFDYRIDKWEEDYVHVFKNTCNGEESYINGIALFSKNIKIANREFSYKFYVNKKEHDLVASKYQYPVYTIRSYKEYQDVIKTVNQPLFWCVRPEIEITDFKIFDLYFDPLNGTYDYDRSENHVFKNLEYYDGLMLASKSKVLTEKEFNFRYPVSRKEWDTVVSQPKPYDIVFISYNESNADENYNKLLSRFPNAKRVHGVKGIHNAHIAAAKLVDTELFWVVDGDAEIVDDFNFTIKQIPYYEKDLKNTVRVWQSKNPINGLEYGYGGVKLLPTKLTIEMDTDTTDMTTSISGKFEPMRTVSNLTVFNTDPFTTWRSAFRECVKLASKVIDRNYEEETDHRLSVWCTLNETVPYGFYAYAGAIAGKAYGEKYVGLPEILSRINDFEWLESEFKKLPSTESTSL
jgi:hypothetical protein